jgi:hypothetical protein
MSVKNKTSLKSAKVWQRHALAKACVLAIAGATVGSTAWAVDPGAALSMTYGTIVGAGAQTLQDYWPTPSLSSGYNSQWLNPQIGSADIMAPITNATYYSSLTGSGSYPVSIVSNSILASVLGNQATHTMTTLNRTGASNDGDLSLNLQIFTGLVTESPTFAGNVSALSTLDNRFKSDGTTANTDGTVYISQAGLASADLSLSNNSMAASAGFNSLNTAVTVATPSGYTSSSKGSSALTFSATGSAMGDPSAPTAGSTGSVNLSNLQGAFNAAGTAQVQGVMAKIGVSGATSALDKAIDLNGNSITATTNSNSAVSVFTSTAASAAFTGTVGVSNSQSIASGGTPSQFAEVSASSIVLDVRKAGASATQVTGSITVNDNVVSAKTTGNTAGSQTASGSILAGNAIVFEGSSNFTGANTTRSTDLTANIGATTANAEADLLINSAQRVADNDFSASVATPKVTVNMDNLSSNGSLTQNGNTLSASVSNNLAGNLISVGQSASMGSMSGSTVVLNTQQTKTVETLASVANGEISAQIGYTGQTVDGSASLNSNAIAATAQGNLALSSVLLKADNLSVGANGATNSVALTPSTGAAVSGLAVSTLNVQSNESQFLAALNTTGSVKLAFDNGSSPVAISGTQASVNSNQLTSAGTGNSASNRTALQSTNAADMNVALGSSQTHTDGSISATSGSSNANKLNVQLDALSTVNGSQLSLSSNTISAQAQINSVSNSLSTTLTNTSGVGGMLTNASSPSAIVGDLTSASVTAKADFALANAQVNTTTSAEATTYGAMTLAAGGVGATAASTLVANSNSIAATAQGNSASNAMSLTNANMSGMTAALASGQLVNTTPITTTTTGDVAVSTVGVGATSKASSVTVNDNAVTAASVANVVSNSLAVTATTASGRAVNASSASPSKTIASSSTSSAKADFALSNSQVLSQTSGVNDIYSTVTGSVKDTTTGDVKGASAITLNANTLTASSMGNSAGNTLSLSVGQLSQADMALASMQTTTLADINASNTASSVALTAPTADISQGAQLTVTNNVLKSTVVASTVTNQVTVSGTNLTAPSLTLADKGAVIGANTTVVATSALANDQTSTKNTLTSSVGTEGTSSSVLLQTNDVSGASVLTLSDNTLASVAYNNNATNGMTLAVTNANGATAALASRQSVDTRVSGSSTSETFGSVKLDAGTVTGASNLTVSGNNISADNVGNSAANRMAVTASQWDGRVAANGRVVPSLAVGTGLNTTASADLAVANQQNVWGAGASTAVIESNVVGTIENNFSSLTLGNITSNANTVSAAATGSTASNTLTMSTTGMTGTTLGVASLQVMNSGKISSTATTGDLDVGVTKTGTGDVAGGNVSVNGNAVQATSQANAVTNSLSVTATNATGTTAAVVPTSSYNLITMTVVADMALVNNQASLTSKVLAEVGTSSTAARIKSDVGAVTLSTNASNLTLNGNSMASDAYANRASNTVAVAANSMNGMTAGLGNAQRVAFGSSTGSLDASTYGLIDSQLSSVDQSNVSVNSNAISATALGNNASNSLTVSGSNASGRSVQPSFTASGLVTVADLVLSNAQTLDYNTLAATTDGNVLAISGTVTGATGALSNLSLNANTISAYGSSNYANNSMLVSPTNLTNATSALMSTQSADRTSGGSTISSVLVRSTGSVQLTAAAVSDATLALNNNSIQSTALDNVVINQLKLTGTTATGDASLTMTGLQSPFTTTSTSSVAADVSLVNLQTSAHDGNMKARTGYDSSDGLAAVNQTLQLAGASRASITASDNSVSSLLYANNASNTLGMRVTTSTAMTAALSNSQQVTTGALTAYTRGDFQLVSTGDVDTASLTLKGNTISATAGANDASSAMTVAATDLVGRDLASRQASVGDFQVVTDFALGNQQQLIDGTTVKAKVTGDIYLNAASGNIGSSKLSLSDNTLSVTSSGNNATNAISMSVTNVSKASVGIASAQSLDGGSSVTSDTTGSIKMSGGISTDSALSAADNTIKATALGNLVTNTLTAAASNYTGPTSSTVTADHISVAADFAIANKQINDSAAAIRATTLGTVQVAVGDVTGTTSASSSNSLTGNTLKALAQSNSGSNEIKLTVTELRSASVGVSSFQNSAAAVSASVGPDTSSSVSNPGLFLVKSGDVDAETTGNVTKGSITVSGNTASALAGMNEAFNTLTVTGSNLLARGLTVTAPTVGTVSSSGADFAVMNTQSGSGSAEASLNAGASGFSSTGNFTAGSVTVNANSLLARASANTANNTLTLAASNRLEASGVVNNLQQMADGATVKASIASTSAVGVELASTSGEAVVTVKDNMVTAQATGNVANNALNASANNAITAAGASGTPTFAVLNYQSTGTSPSSPAYGVQSIINGISVGGSQLGGALNGGSATVAGNQVLSVAYGNSANNSVVVSALTPTLNTASASITSVQYNLTSVTATIGNTTVQASGAAGSSGANVGITGNSIVAMAVGNRSVNTITGR